MTDDEIRKAITGSTHEASEEWVPDERAHNRAFLQRVYREQIKHLSALLEVEWKKALSENQGEHEYPIGYVGEALELLGRFCDRFERNLREGEYGGKD